MPHDLPLPTLTGQIPYDVEQAILRLQAYTLALDAGQDAAAERLTGLSDALEADRRARAQPNAALLVAILETTRLSASEIVLEGFTPDSVLYVGDDHTISEDPPNFTWDDAGRRLDLRGDLASPGILRLSTAEPTVVVGNKLGQIDFVAPVEASGGDAVLVGASIWAQAEGTFGGTNNATTLFFATGASETATPKMVLTSLGRLGVGKAAPTVRLDVEEITTATSGTKGMVQCVLLAAPGGASTQVATAASSAVAMIGGANLTGGQTALNAQISNLNTGTVTVARGFNLLCLNAAAGTMTTAVGGLFLTKNSSTGTIASAIAGQFAIQNTDAGGTITTGFGVKVNDVTNTGTLTTMYGVHIGTMLGASKWGLYQSAAADHNYFAGRVGMGVTVPSTNLDIEQNFAGSTGIRLGNSNAAGNIVITLATLAGRNNRITSDGRLGLGTNGVNDVVFIDSAGQMGVNTTLPQTLVDVQGDAGAAGILTLSTAEVTVVAADVLGQLNFQAPLEGSGGDAVLVAAAIWAAATNTFAVGANETALILATASAGAASEKWRVTHDGDFLAAVTGAALGWTARTRLLSSGDGLLTLVDAAETAFSRLMFGGVTSSFPALRRSGTTLGVRLADDSADAPLTCATLAATAITCTTLDTGQGAHELYAMDQDVQIADNVVFADLRATGAVRFGTHAGLGAEVLSGFITITDDGGTPRKLAVIS